MMNCKGRRKRIAWTSRLERARWLVLSELYGGDRFGPSVGGFRYARACAALDNARR